MRIHGRERRSQLSLCLAAAHKFLLPEERGLAIIKRQIAAVAENWEAVCSEAALSDADRRLLWRRQFLNDQAFEGLESPLAKGIELRDNLRSAVSNLPSRPHVIQLAVSAALICDHDLAGETRSPGRHCQRHRAAHREPHRATAVGCPGHQPRDVVPAAESDTEIRGEGPRSSDRGRAARGEKIERRRLSFLLRQHLSNHLQILLCFFQSSGRRRCKPILGFFRG